ncbi:chorismate mutase [Limobrevibacterium gyesilva]|uniref:chorismate mutase n=1 Tax=Limobrevibacterium gyesilva TaxID=2991712 RepID=A0AA41YN79_9PROT|nr:chorismate mutase [Limobrevibacterium gyesilva]MCW3476991.1 chorismate mutase [Limobrevibacterium gyesilva]
MSSTHSAAETDQTPQAPNDATAQLAALRLELDRLDDAIHDLLMQRADVVVRVAALGAKGRVAFRPGREAEIIRRLLRRHAGPLPRRLLSRLWRELFAATTSMQGPYVITVCETGAGNEFVQCAREHFGALTPLRVHHSPAQAIAEVSAGSATAAVLPMPADEEVPATAWWIALLHRDEPRIHVVARLPFWAPRSEGAPQVQALVVAAVAPDPSAQDRSLVGLELPLDMSRARLSAGLAAAGFTQSAAILRRDAGAQMAHALVEVDGYVADGDGRLAAIPDVLRPPVVLGAYAVPLDGDNA